MGKAGFGKLQGATGFVDVADGMRRVIVEGRYAPGALLPSRTEIEKQFWVSRVTAQRAMQVLHGEGFIRMAGRRGTYVASRPPHLWNYALVFGEFPSDHHLYWTLFHQTLVAQAAVLDAAGDRTITVYYGISDEQRETPAFGELQEAIRTHRFAGLIFVGRPFTAAHPRAAQDAGVPYVQTAGSTVSDMGVVSFDMSGFVRRSVEAMAASGCRGVAVLAHALQGDLAQRITHELDRRGIVTHRRWSQRVDLNHPETTANVIESVTYAGQDERPDGLIVTDDNLVEPTLAGMRAGGVQPGVDIEVVAHCNFPRPRGGAGSVRWLGFDIRRLLREAMAAIDARRRGESPASILIPAQFDEELDASPPLSAVADPSGVGLADPATGKVFSGRRRVSRSLTAVGNV